MTSLSRRARALALSAALLVGGGAALTATAAPASAATHPAKRGYSGHCERWVRRQFGASSGFPTAMANWRDAVRRGVAHRGDRTPPRGALVFWNAARGEGHVGISVGGGRFRDYRGTHAISSMANYLGWAPERYA